MQWRRKSAWNLEFFGDASFRQPAARCSDDAGHQHGELKISQRKHPICKKWAETAGSLSRANRGYGLNDSRKYNPELGGADETH
jgi:hypothetical protein